MKKWYRVWKEDTEKQLVYLTQSQVVEYKHDGYYVSEV